MFEFVLGDPGTQNNGRQGQEQHGVDIFGREGGGDGRLVGIQCKGKDGDYDHPVTEAELTREVENTKAFRPPLRRFILATTAGDDARIQEKARLLEEKIRAEGRELSIEVWGWGRLHQEIVRYPDAVKAFHPDASPFTDQILDGQREINAQLRKEAEGRGTFEERIFQAIAAISTRTDIAADVQLPQRDSFDKHLHDQIDTYRDFIRDGRPRTAIDLLTILRGQVWETASEKVRFRITANIGAAHHLLGRYDIAADFLLEAAPYNPDEPTSIANKIAALLIKHREGEAHALAVDAIGKHPDNPDIALQRLQARGPEEAVEDVWATLSPAVTNAAPMLIFRIVALREIGDPSWEHLANQALRDHPEDQKLKLIYAEAVLGRVLKGDQALLGATGDVSPSRAELERAAAIFETGWSASLGRETSPEGFLAHNAALLRRVFGQEEEAKGLLDAALQAGFEADETKRFRIYLYPQRNSPKEAFQLADSLTDSSYNAVVRANLWVDREPKRAREILAGRDNFSDLRDIIPAALVFVESLTREQMFAEALSEAERLQVLLPDNPSWAVAKYRIEAARGLKSAELWLNEALKLVSEETDFGTRFLICEALARAQRHDDIVDLLRDHTATTHDSHALRLLVAAAGNADRRYILNQLLAQVPCDLLQLPFYRTGRISLAIHTGDVKTAEKEIREYLELVPRDIEMHLLLMHALFRQNKIEELREEVRRPSSDFDGAPEKFMQLAQFKNDFGDWREAHDLAYRTYLANLTSSTVSMGYVAVFLRPGHSSDLDITPASVEQNMAVSLLTDDGVRSVYVLEPSPELRPTADYLPPDHKVAGRLLGQPVGAEIELPDQSKVQIEWIKPKVLHALHQLLENFQIQFPDNEGLERVRIRPDQPDGLQPVLDRVRERHDAIQDWWRRYESGFLPLALVARAIGSGPVDAFMALVSAGRVIRVCAGTQPERDVAFAAIEQNGIKGCVLDAVTLHIVRRLKLEKAVVAVCGPIGIVEQTSLRVQQKIFEIEERIDEPDLSLLWRDGQYYRSELSPAEKREALALVKSDREWINQVAIILPAQGTGDPGSQLTTLIKRLGGEFVDEIFATQASGRLLVCEDQQLRSTAHAQFGMQSAWLQPVLMKAVADNHMTLDEYLNAVLGFIDSGFDFVSVDASLLLQAVDGTMGHSLPKNFVKLASRLGGKNAEIRSHIGVAVQAIKATWPDQRLSSTVRQAIVGKLLENLCKERPLNHTYDMIGAFAKFGDLVFHDPAFLSYLDSWCEGHFIPPPPL